MTLTDTQCEDMTPVDGASLQAAAVARGVKAIPHHDCACCGMWVHYIVDQGNLYFDPSCGCAGSNPRSCAWSEAAEWVNIQTNPEARQKILASFGWPPPPPTNIIEAENHTGLRLSKLSPAARAYHDEYWEWIWHGSDSHRTLGDKKDELRFKYGEAAEMELMAVLRAEGFLKPADGE